MPTLGETMAEQFPHIPAPQAGLRRIGWLGEASPFDDPLIEYRRDTGQYTREQLAVLREAARRRVQRLPGCRTSRALEPGTAPGQIPGLTQRYEWGPRTTEYVRYLTFSDADKVLACSDGHEFIDLDSTEMDEPVVIQPPVAIRVIESSMMDRFGRLVEAV